MAVTKQIHAVVAPWSVVQVADAFRDALIGAGLMTSWYDSFISGGFEHRILEVVYDAAKTYGKTYYWFIFSGTEIRWKVVAGWDSTNKIPKGPTSAGSLGFDWPENATAANSVTNYSYLASTADWLTLASSVNMSITRYTAGGISYFLIRSATAYAVLTIDPPSVSLRSWYQDALIGAMHPGISEVRVPSSYIRFFQRGRTKRCLLFGAQTDIGQYNAGSAFDLSAWGFGDMSNNNGGNGRLYGGFPGLCNNIPQWIGADINNGVLSDFLPVFNQFRRSVIYNADLPADFGIGALRYAGGSTVAIQDTMVVTAGVEEYEVLGFNNRGTTGQATHLFLARTVG